MLNIAVIGCGDMGTKHGRAWSLRDDASVTAVCDLDRDRCAVLAERHGAAPFADWRAALGHPGLDAVSICIPARDHAEVAIAAAARGLHVLCEKPMALRLDEADAMIAAAATAGVRLAVSHQYRGLARYRTYKALIETGALGSPLHIRFMEMREVRPKLAMHRQEVSGGPIHDMSGHLFDLARFLTGAEARSVLASGGVFGRGKARLDGITALGIDAAEILVRFEGGHALSIGINWGLPEGTPSLSQEAICGPEGVAHTENRQNPDLNLGEISDTVEVVVKNGDGTRRIALEADIDGPDVCIADLVAAIREDRAPVFGGSEGRAALRLILATLRSIETGREVVLDGGPE